MLSSQGEPLHALIFAGATAIVVLFLEPFYVASGFRDVPHSPRGAGSVGHRAGVPPCVRRSRLLAAVAVLLFAAFDLRRAQARRSLRRAHSLARKSPLRSSEIKKDPNLARERTIRTLKWVKSGEDKKKKRDLSWLEWIGEMFALADGERPLPVLGRAGGARGAAARISPGGCVRNWSVPRKVGPHRCAELRARSRHSARRVCPRTSAPSARQLWTAASIARLSRCSTAAFCRGWCTFTRFRSGIRAPKATALRWPVVI